jgi:integrase
MQPAKTDRRLLEDAAVRKLTVPAKGSKIFYDGGDLKKCVKGFGIRITAGGALAFVLNYRIAGRERRLTIGSFPEWSTKAAREEAKKLRREIDGGHDPLAERIAEREAPTVNELIERYRADHASRKRQRSRIEDESLMRQWINPELGSLKVIEIRRSDVERLHRKITASGTPIRANRTITLLSRMLTLAMRWEMRDDNPASGIERNHEEARQRFLSGEELRRLIEAIAVHPNQAAANAVRLLLLTGARRSEVLGATWDQFDLETGVWTKPSAHTKQKRVHRVPLSGPARQLLTEMKAAAEQRKPSPYLFPGRGVDGPMVEIKIAWSALRKAAGLNDMRLHDLRHTYASVLASAGLSLPVIGALLGHTQPGTTARYAHLFDDPLRRATEHVGLLMSRSGSQTAEIIEMPQSLDPATGRRG